MGGARGGRAPSNCSMKTSKWPSAWEPLTPRGVAAFAGASLRRLLLVQLIVAILFAGLFVRFLIRAWVPVIRTAVDHLPAQGRLRDQQLFWPADSSVQLARNRFLGLAVDLNHSGFLVREAHLQLEFGRKNLRIMSAFGYQVINYPPEWDFPFNRTDLVPWWGTWNYAILTVFALATPVCLMLVWFAIATIYCLPVFFISIFEKRKLGVLQCWRVAAAALLPGTIFLTLGLLFYTHGWINFVHLVVIFALHLIIGWIYLYISPLFVPKKGVGSARKRKPSKAKVTVQG